MVRWLDSEQAKALLDARPVTRTVALNLIAWGTMVGTLRTLQDLHPAVTAGDAAVLAVLKELEELELVDLSEAEGVYTVSWTSPCDGSENHKTLESREKREETSERSEDDRRGGRKERGCGGKPLGEGSYPQEQMGLPGVAKGKRTPRKRPPTKGQVQWRQTERLVRLWVERTERPASDLKVTPYRIKLVKERLAEGYTWEELAMAVAGVCYSPWHRDNGKDLFELAVGEGQVDKAKGLWWANAPVEMVRTYQDRTGHTPPAREADLQEADRADQVEAASREQTARTSSEVAKLQEVRRREEAAQAAEADQWVGVFTDDDDDQGDQEAAGC